MKDDDEQQITSAELRDKSRRWLWPALALIALIAIVSVVLAGRSAPPEPTAVSAKEEHGHDHHHDGEEEHPAGLVILPIEQQWAIKLKHVPVEHAAVAQQITTTGRVVPALGQQVVIAPPVGGMITGGQLPRVGQRVAKGQVLAVLRQQISAAEAAQIAAANAQLQIEQAKLEAERKRLAQEVERAKAEYDLTVVALDHANKLYARKAYSIHQQLEAKAKQQIAEATYRSAVQQLEALDQVTLPSFDKTKEAKLNGFTMTAPISGTVVKVRKAEGEQVAVGEAMLEIINLETVWVEAPIFERDLHLLSKTARAVVTTSAYPDREFSGTLVDIGAVIDEQTRAATAIFQLANPNRVLLAGMQANVRLRVGGTKDAVLIPKEAVLENDGKRVVFVVFEGEEFEPREVTVGEVYGDKIAVLSGLKADDRVVTQGAYQLRLKQLRPGGNEDAHAGHNHAH